MTTITTLFILAVICIPFVCAQESTLSLSSHSNTTAGSYYYDDGSFDIAMSTFFLLLIPSLIGLSLSFALIKRSFFPSNRVANNQIKQDDSHNSDSKNGEGNDVVEIEMKEICDKKFKINEVLSTDENENEQSQSKKFHSAAGPSPHATVPSVDQLTHKLEVAKLHLKTFTDWMGIIPSETDEKHDISSHTNSTSSFDEEDQHSPGVTDEQETSSRSIVKVILPSYQFITLLFYFLL
jgi:hypothetical protein